MVDAVLLTVNKGSRHTHTHTHTGSALPHSYSPAFWQMGRYEHHVYYPTIPLWDQNGQN